MRKTFKNEIGITLIALVVTIVVLLILAGITINMLFSNGGIFRTAQDAANAWNEAVINEQESLDNIADQIANLVNGQVGGGTTPENPTIGPNGKPLVETLTEIQTENNVEAEDEYGNPVTVPKGFKVVVGSVGEKITVPNGVVVEDVAENQFVWIPVGIVYKNAEKTDTATIKLGRYTFDEDDGTPTMQQAAFAGDNPNNASQTYENTVTINSYYQELTIARDGVESTSTNGLNATAKDLAGFMQSVSDHGGYYIARYEASYGSGSSTADWKPLSKISTATRQSTSTPLTQGTLWTSIKQLAAAQVARNMYAGNKDIEENSVGVESDLINSYAWDTAIVYVQQMGHDNYANYSRDETGNTSLMDTGKTGDVVCNIYDMAANAHEWTTEYSTLKRNGAVPSVSRGGDFAYSTNYTAAHIGYSTTITSSATSFRCLLYVK